MAFNRALQDAAFQKSKALPAAAASNDADGVDLGTVALGPTGDHIELEVSIPATPSLVDAKIITLTIKDSADGETYAAIPELSTLVRTGAGGAGAAAATRRVRLPRTTRRFVTVGAAVETGGGSNIAVSYSYKLIF
jgi:hypothetical protein